MFRNAYRHTLTVVRQPLEGGFLAVGGKRPPPLLECIHHSRTPNSTHLSAILWNQSEQAEDSFSVGSSQTESGRFPFFSSLILLHTTCRNPLHCDCRVYRGCASSSSSGTLNSRVEWAPNRCAERAGRVVVVLLFAFVLLPLLAALTGESPAQTSLSPSLPNPKESYRLHGRQYTKYDSQGRDQVQDNSGQWAVFPICSVPRWGPGCRLVTGSLLFRCYPYGMQRKDICPDMLSFATC